MKKLIGKFLLIFLPIIIALFLLYPTFRASQLEGLKKEALAKAKKAKNPDDSLRIMEKFEKDHGKDLESAKSQRLKLGLDLRGGMYVTMEVDVVKLIEESAQRDAVDEAFTEVIEKTRQEARISDEKVLDIFMKYFNQIARKKGKSLISYFEVGDLRDVSEEKILEKLQENVNSAIDQANEVIRQRIDKYGVAEPTIQKQGNRRILLELPGVSNEEEMKKLLQTTARLEFNLVKNDKNIVRRFFQIDKLLSEKAKRGKNIMEEPGLPALDSLAAGDTTKIAQADTNKGKEKLAKADSTKADSTKLKDSASTAEKPDTTNPYAGLPEEEVQKRYLEDHPFTSLFQTIFLPPGENQQSMPVNYITDAFPEGDYSFIIYEPTLKKFNQILSRPEIKALLPIDIKIVREAKPITRIAKESKIDAYYFFALKAEPELTGDVVSDARATFDPQDNQPMVLMYMNSDGAERWARITGANLKKRIAIVLDDQIYSAPTVQTKITGGSSQITGMANVQEARLLEIVLKAGALKAPVQIIEERVVGPSLGEDSIRSGITASAIAFCLVILYMVFYYNKGGGIADFAVLLNIFLVISILAAFGGTLTLPGIGGIILTMGMAVDANVLIFERIREELHKGRSFRSAIDEGFSKALSAIVDSNITTGLTAIILYFMGTGPIQGFALTLLIGIFGTLFTAILVSRAIVEIFIAKGVSQFSFGQPKSVKA